MYPFHPLSIRRDQSDLSSEPENSQSTSSRKSAHSKENLEPNGNVTDAEQQKLQPQRSGSLWRSGCVSRSLHPVFMTLQILALFPNPNSKRKHRWRRVTRLILMLNYSALALLFNSYLLNKNMWLITAYKERFGLMHASTVSCIITGIKPMINIFIIGLFAIRVRQHLRLIK
ncbi:hypothetical protein RB195_015251 [Necator americanus]|uniref:G-protein coupled receptors family 1 profile domain-containing protein n=1 Tax=Necator americanus TaxID=51031 RepID=A0ABR1E3T7_NECAM